MNPFWIWEQTDGDRERDRAVRSQMLMAAQIRVHDLNREAILAQAVPEILPQPVREIGCRLWPKVLLRRVEVSEQS